jgi:succinylarginine dihydrolase
MPGDATFLEVRNFGFAGTADEQVRQAIGSTDGFALRSCTSQSSMPAA